MHAVEVRQPGGDFVSVERPLPTPGPNQVRLRVEACGICHSDAIVKEGLMPGIAYPRVPGHEIAGRVDQVGGAVAGWAPGDRAGIGWHGGHDFHCEACRSGDFINCENAQVTGMSFDGGYAEYVVAPQEALARIPADLPAAEAAPLLCAGITTYNALRNSGARPGDLVAVQGIGGLGHLALQFARRMGFHTVAVSGGREKEALARQLGAHEYIDARSQDAGAELSKLGGARVILATAPDSGAIQPLLSGLWRRGKLLIVAAARDPLPIPPVILLSGKSVAGWPSGAAKDSEDTMNFSSLTGVRPMIECFPLARAAEAYERMITNRARFRVVLQPGT